MAAMVARGSSSSLPSLCNQESGSRNKRKFRADPPVADASPLARPFQSECPNFELFQTEKAPENFNLEHLASVCDMCKTLMCGPKDGIELEDFQDADWSDLTETQLEEILLGNLDTIFKNSIKIISSYGYTEEVAMKAILSSGLHCGCKDAVSSIVDNALALLRSGQEIDPSPMDNFSEDLQKLERDVLADMVNVVREVQPFFSTGDAMWCLLICDMNVSHACAIDGNPLNGIGNDDTSSSPITNQLQLDSTFNTGTSPAIPESVVSRPERLRASLPFQRDMQPEVPKVLGVPSLPYGKFSVSSDVQSKISNLKLTENPITSPDQVEKSSSPSVSKTLLEEKPVSRMVHLRSSKKESILQEKIHLEKSYRALGSKAASRACKHSGSGKMMSDRKYKCTSDSKGLNLKSSLKVDKVMGLSTSQADVTLNPAFPAGLSSNSSFNTKSISPSLMPMANTELSLSLPSTSSCPSAKQDSSVEAPDNVTYDKICKDWVPKDKKDELVLNLVPYKRELQAQIQDWIDWAQLKVMQAARRLAKDKDELQSLRQEKEEVRRLQEERQNLEESTRKKLTEMETAIAKASGQVERANAAARRLEVENAQLRLEMEAAKLQAAESAANCQELSWKEAKTLKKFQSWETQRALLQEELVTEKHNLSQQQRKLEQAKEQQEHLQSRWRQEENLKNEAITLANSERKEREQIETSVKSQENILMLKAENDSQRYKLDIRGLEQKISQLRSSMDSSKIAALRWSTDRSYASQLSDGRKNGNSQFLVKAMDSQELGLDDIQRERECVMCLTEEMAVVFLPCAHQVVCTKCNELHEKQGMRDCPSCRTPIQRRICVRSADS
ncbi:putative E3 ubiquitin-protein ligase RF298 [Typha latifolia]|uniref:putative E3 ubiquitin-protein ligase RF298 n=1 Tax=Typha latifolia TaxID=4733 RepID=UPI003C2BF74B